MICGSRFYKLGFKFRSNIWEVALLTAHSDSWADSSCPDSLYPGRLICERLLSGLFLENNTFSLLRTPDSINKIAAPRELPSVTSKFRTSSQLLHKILWKKLKIIPISMIKWLFSQNALVDFFWSLYQVLSFKSSNLSFTVSSHSCLYFFYPSVYPSQPSQFLSHSGF